MESLVLQQMRVWLCLWVYVKAGMWDWMGIGIALTGRLDHEVLLSYMLTD